MPGKMKTASANVSANVRVLAGQTRNCENSVCPVQYPRGFTDAFLLRPEILCQCPGAGGADAELE